MRKIGPKLIFVCLGLVLACLVQAARLPPRYDPYAFDAVAPPSRPGEAASEADNSPPSGFTFKSKVPVPVGNDTTASSWATSFVAGLSVIVVSEIGDKTFLIAAIMAMKHPRWVVFSGALAALVPMTILAVAVGKIVVEYLPVFWTKLVAVLLFLIFGFLMLKEGIFMKRGGPNDEVREVVEEIEEVDQSSHRELEKGPVSPGFGDGYHAAPSTDGSTNGSSPSDEVSPAAPLHHVSPVLSSGASVHSTGGLSIASSLKSARSILERCLRAIFIQTMYLTFFAEWGDRSQIATIALVATHDPIGLTLGAVMGHVICTTLAVLGGSFLAYKISIRTMTLLGAILFLFFAVISALELFLGIDVL